MGGWEGEKKKGKIDWSSDKVVWEEKGLEKCYEMSIGFQEEIRKVKRTKLLMILTRDT